MTDNAFNSLAESIKLSREITDRFIQANTAAQAENTRAIAQLGTKIDKLSDTVSAQSASIERMERAINTLVAGIREQKDAIAQMVEQQAAFLELVKQQQAHSQQQTDLIDRLTGGKVTPIRGA